MYKSLYKTYTRTNKRDNNEDACLSFVLTPQMEDNRECIKVLLLSDGMGGHDHGEVISNKVIAAMATNITKDILLKSIAPDLYGTQKLIENIDFKRLLHEAIIMANQTVLQLIENNKWRRTGATLVAVIVYQNKYFWGYLGDSRLYQWHKTNQKLQEISYDHNVPGILVNEGVLKPEVARFHAQRNQLVYYMGVEKVPNLDKVGFIGEGVLDDGDVLFLCSDGVNSDLEHETIANWFYDMTWNSESDIEIWCEELLDKVTENGESDNQTIVFYEHISKTIYRSEIMKQDYSDREEKDIGEEEAENIDETINEPEKVVKENHEKMDDEEVKDNLELDNPKSKETIEIIDYEAVDKNEIIEKKKDS